MQERETSTSRCGRGGREGFTLIELMIVVVIIGILAAIAIPRFTNVSRQAKAAEAGPLLKQILTLQERYQAKEGTYTADLTLLEGGPRLATSGKYFTFSVDVSHPTGLCIQANPNAVGIDAGLSPRSMDAQAETYESATCS